MSGIIRVIGQDNYAIDVEQGVGLGIRQHDDVMLAYGLSKQVQLDISIPSGNYVLIALEVLLDINHHAEGRYVSAYNAPCELWILPNYQGALPGGGTLLPIWNNKGPYLDTSGRSTFSYWGPLATNPLGSDPVPGEWADNIILRATTGQGVRASTSDAFSGVAGRYYNPGTHVVLIKNIDSATAEFTYQYSWHDFE